MKLIWIFSKVVGLKLKIQIHVYVQQMPLLTTVGKNMTELKIWKRRHKDGEFLSLSLSHTNTHIHIYIYVHTHNDIHITNSFNRSARTYATDHSFNLITF